MLVALYWWALNGVSGRVSYTVVVQKTFQIPGPIKRPFLPHSNPIFMKRGPLNSQVFHFVHVSHFGIHVMDYNTLCVSANIALYMTVNFTLTLHVCTVDACTCI